MDGLAEAAHRAETAVGREAKLAAAAELLTAGLRVFGRGLSFAWTGGKDSTVLVWLAREICRRHALPPPRVLTIDEGDTFPEIAAFQARLAWEWDLDLTVIGNAELLGRKATVGDYVPVAALGPANREVLASLGFTGSGFPFDPDSPLGCRLMKIEPLADFLRADRAAALAVAIRRDEHPARADERFLRDRPDPPHMRLHPLLHLTEREIWDTIHGNDIPFCPLYREGYRSLGTRSGSSPAGNVPAWEQDLEHTQERGGRAEAKEQAMAGLRALGYM